MNPSWFEHVDLMQVVIVLLLSYVAWSVRRFVIKVERTHALLSRVIKTLAILVTEHRQNHECSSVKIDELLNEDQ